MGTVLAMKRAIRTAGLILAATVTLSGCGALDALRQGGAPADPRVGLTRAALQEYGRPVLYVRLPRSGTAALLDPVGRNGDVVTWQAPGRISLSLDSGVLTATRGMGADLMSAELGDTRKMLVGTPAASGYARLYGHLDGEHRPVFKSFLCRPVERTLVTITLVGQSHRVTRIAEACTSPDMTVINSYWRGSDGMIWKSRQWVSPDIGYVETERLNR